MRPSENTKITSTTGKVSTARQKALRDTTRGTSCHTKETGAYQGTPSLSRNRKQSIAAEKVTTGAKSAPPQRRCTILW